MRTLILLRHAKSSWSDESLADFDRPLADRGRKTAPGMGRHMREIGLTPDQVLCSPALRTRQTAALVLAELGEPRVAIDFDASLYAAEAGTLLARVEQTTAGVRQLLLIGHNPGLQELALLLAQENDAPERTSIAGKLPTCALVVLELRVRSWPKVQPGIGRIVHYMTPRMLAGA